MKNLIIKLNSNIEIVNNSIIQKLYELASNVNISNVELEGNLLSDHATMSAYNWLTGNDTLGNKRFPNLVLNITNGLYIEFADPIIFLYCLDNYTSSGSTGVTKTQVEAVTSANFWGKNLTPQQKSEVQTLEDFLYFIGIAGETENVVLDFTNATKIKFPSATFTNNSIYSRDIIRNCRNISQVDYSNAVFYSSNTAYCPILGNDVITEFNSSLLPNQNDFENICLFDGWTKLTKIIFPEGIKNTRERFGGNNSLLYAEFPSTIISLGDCYNLGRNSGHSLPCMVVKAVTPPDWYGWNPTDTGGTGNGLGWEQIPLAIYVPDNSVTAYKSVANGGTNDEQLWARLDIKSIIKPLSELPLMYREMGTVTQADIDRT